VCTEDQTKTQTKLTSAANGRCWRIVLKDSLLKRREFADSFGLGGGRPEAMMGTRQIDQAALFYEFPIERHVPATHMAEVDRPFCRFVRRSEPPDAILQLVTPWGFADEIPNISRIAVCMHKQRARLGCRAVMVRVDASARKATKETAAN
jgi:hypothetical protein